MEKSAETRLARGETWYFGPASILLFALLTGCASQGPPRPPSLHLPAQVGELRAERVGNAVNLHWTTPTSTTDGLPLSGKHVPQPLTAEVCRAVAGASTCLPGVPVQPGKTGTLHDSLPAALTAGQPSPLTYRVRILNGQGKGADYASVRTLAGLAPRPLQGVAAGRVRDGVLIRWQAGSGAEGEQVQLHVRRGVAPSQDAKQEILLSVEPLDHDAGGALDSGAKPGIAQRYTVARTRSVRVAGVELSMSGEPATVEAAADQLAPAPAQPAGLETVSNSLAAPEIDLVWQPSAGAAGYRVYRAEADGTPQLLTPELVSGLSYSDKAVRPGTRYRYSVSAVGTDGREGPHSREASDEVSGR